MRISKIVIKNFRNFKSLNIRVGEHAVILGENKVGKTNLLFALRLILDPALPDSMRKLRLEDFWDGLPRPLTKDDRIEVSLEFRGFEASDNLLAVLADHLVQPSPMVARVTYRFQPVAGVESPRSEADYEFIIFGGDRLDNTVGYELRRWMPLDLFHALRDAESDLARWSRSPLRPLLDRAAQKIDPKELARITCDVHKTTTKLIELQALSDVAGRINDQLIKMVGNAHAIETVLGFAPTDPERLLRALQMMIDGGRRGVAEASLGSANVLYIALKHLEQQRLVDDGERQHTFLAIEEPEAHLHPHLQRLIYRNYLQARGDADAKTEPRTILLTTHSPNVASVAPLTNIIVLRQARLPELCTVGRSLKGISLDNTDRADLERYIDVTRGEIFFSRAVILVEGDAEKFLLPALAKLHDDQLDFDALGITVCAIAGTNFAPYVQLLGQYGLDIPFAVLTDFDPKGKPTSQEDGDPDSKATTKSFGRNRVYKLMTQVATAEDRKGKSFSDIVDVAKAYGIFLNDFTFEVDLFKNNASPYFNEAIESITDNTKMKVRFRDWAIDPDTLDEAQFLKDIDSLGKGRVAQRLAAVLLKREADVCPPYISAAFDYLVERLS
jgi:putative ATP-dependent endonuclease of OLD family